MCLLNQHHYMNLNVARVADARQQIIFSKKHFESKIGCASINLTSLHRAMSGEM